MTLTKAKYHCLRCGTHGNPGLGLLYCTFGYCCRSCEVYARNMGFHILNRQTTELYDSPSKSWLLWLQNNLWTFADVRMITNLLGNKLVEV